MPRYDIYSNSEIAPRSSDPRIDSLAGDYRYTDPVITFSFPGIGARWPYQGDPYHANFAPLSAAQQDVFRAAMASWGTVIAKPIVETTDGEYVGDVRPALGSDPGQANYSHTWYPGYIPGGSVIWYGDNLRYSAWAGGTWDYAIVLHEIGHTLGLSHPFDTSTRLSGYEDNRDHTVMSYIGSYSFYPTTPMVLDIQAVQFLYGANMAWHSGNDVYAFDDSIPYHQTLWDGGGNDTIQYNGAHDATIDLVAGSPSRMGLDVIDYSTNGPMDNVWIAYGAVIENAQGGRATTA